MAPIWVSCSRFGVHALEKHPWLLGSNGATGAQFWSPSPGRASAKKRIEVLELSLVVAGCAHGFADHLVEHHLDTLFRLEQEVARDGRARKAELGCHLSHGRSLAAKDDWVDDARLEHLPLARLPRRLHPRTAALDRQLQLLSNPFEIEIVRRIWNGRLVRSGGLGCPSMRSSAPQFVDHEPLGRALEERAQSALSRVCGIEKPTFDQGLRKEVLREFLCASHAHAASSKP